MPGVFIMKDKKILNTIILQYESFKIHYSLYPVDKNFDSVVYDKI